MKRAYAYMHIAIFLWGFTGILGRAISLDYGQLVWYRMLISALSLGLYIWFKKEWVAPRKKEIVKMLATGSIVAIHWVLFYAAIKFSNVSVTLSCFATITLFTAIFEPIFFSRKIVGREIMLSLFTIVGIAFIAAAQQVFITGILLALASAAMGSVFTIFNKKFVANHVPTTVTFLELSGGFLFLTLILPVYFGITSFSFQIPGAWDFLFLMLLSIVCTTLAFSLSLIALQKLNAFVLNLSVNLEPLYSIILAILIFKENTDLNGGFYLGTAIILGAVFIHGLLQFKARPK
nr:DMT family transporter [Bacteroidota bacterium]